MTKWPLSWFRSLFLIMLVLNLPLLGKSSAEGEIFSVLKLNNLNQQLTTVPNPQKKVTVLIVADNHKLQTGINSWLRWLKQVQQTNPGMAFYEIPLVDEKYKPYWSAISLFMKRQLPDSSYFSVTLPYFILPLKGLKYYQINTNQINIWLINAQGKTIYRTTGILTAEKQHDVLQNIQRNE